MIQSEAQVAQQRALQGEVPPAVRAVLEAKLETGALELPLLPGVAMDLTSAATREEVDVRTIAQMLKGDAALSAHVLRIVNSPIYSPRSQIVSLQQAVTRVGASKIREIALIIACKTGVFKAKGYERELDDVFRHSVATALFAQEIARQTRHNVEDAFLCGLLHDVGRPVILQALLTQLRDTPQTIPRDVVLALVSEVHERAGAALAKAWGLPETVIHALARHHSARLELEGTPTRIASLADHFAHFAFDSEPLTATSIGDHPALRLLEIYPDALEKLVQRVNALRETVGVLA